MDKEKNDLRLDICRKSGVEQQFFTREESLTPELSNEPQPESKVELSKEEVKHVSYLINQIIDKLDEVLMIVHIDPPKDDGLPF